MVSRQLLGQGLGVDEAALVWDEAGGNRSDQCCFGCHISSENSKEDLDPNVKLLF